MGVDHGVGGGGVGGRFDLLDRFFDGLFSVVDLHRRSLGNDEGDGLGGGLFRHLVTSGAIAGQVLAGGGEIGPGDFHFFLRDEAGEALDSEDVPTVVHEEPLLVVVLASGLETGDEPGPVTVRAGGVTGFDQHGAIEDGVIGRFDAAGVVGGGGALEVVAGGDGGGGVGVFFDGIGEVVGFFAAHEGHEGDGDQE